MLNSKCSPETRLSLDYNCIFNELKKKKKEKGYIMSILWNIYIFLMVELTHERILKFYGTTTMSDYILTSST